VIFYSALALAVGLLVVAPYLAHRLRRRSAEERPFPPARLVQPAPPRARRRARLEDQALYATRAAVVVALALLGATPFVRCSRLSLQRSGGASVAMAVVLDDSMSMEADLDGKPRFVRARDGARELLSSAREGDEVAIVLAGAPARVALAATTDLGAARNALDAIAPSDRATDLDGAIVLARGLVASLPQLDRRIVVLSDLADGQPDAPPLGDSSNVPVWVALPELVARGTDCALTRADRRGARVRVAVACGPGANVTGREVVVEDAKGNALGRAPVAIGATGSMGSAAAVSESTVQLPSADASAVRARLSGADAISDDDVAPVVSDTGRGGIAVVADSAEEAVATGGAPIVEQALSALKLDLDVRPVPALPDRLEDLAGEVGVLLDDPPGLTPEQRHALGAFVEGGGLVLLALGPHAAAAPLGATLEPILARAVTWKDAGRVGADPASAVGVLLGSAGGLADLGASRRALLAPEDAGAFEALLKWTDGAPLVARRSMSRGETWIVTLPFSADASDLPLRPAFLALLDAWVRTAREHAAPRRSDVGTVWKFPGARRIQVEGPRGPIAEAREDGVPRVTPSLVGPYEILVDGRTELRVASPVAREIDLRPRRLAQNALGERLGERRAAVDISGQLAIALLALMGAEIVLRVASRRRAGAA
jgi:hypothetical protein